MRETTEIGVGGAVVPEAYSEQNELSFHSGGEKWCWSEAHLASQRKFFPLPAVVTVEKRETKMQ